jgi:hypothetical protein
MNLGIPPLTVSHVTVPPPPRLLTKHRVDDSI